MNKTTAPKQNSRGCPTLRVSTRSMARGAFVRSSKNGVGQASPPGDETGCGGLTGITPLLRYRDWIVDTARKLNSPLAP